MKVSLQAAHPAKLWVWIAGAEGGGWGAGERGSGARSGREGGKRGRQAGAPTLKTPRKRYSREHHASVAEWLD